jgi:hypothetical protein
MPASIIDGAITVNRAPVVGAEIRMAGGGAGGSFSADSFVLGVLLSIGADLAVGRGVGSCGTSRKAWGRDALDVPPYDGAALFAVSGAAGGVFREWVVGAAVRLDEVDDVGADAPGDEV